MTSLTTATTDVYVRVNLGDLIKMSNLVTDIDDRTTPPPLPKITEMYNLIEKMAGSYAYLLYPDEEPAQVEL